MLDHTHDWPLEQETAAATDLWLHQSSRPRPIAIGADYQTHQTGLRGEGYL
jgi:hypothetical protein